MILKFVFFFIIEAGILDVDMCAKYSKNDECEWKDITAVFFWVSQ